MSIATIAADGAFSSFPGCDRILMPLDGDLELSLDGRRHDVPYREVIRFRGEQAVEAIGVMRPGTDLNVIVSRAWGAAVLEIVEGRGSSLRPGPRQTLLIVALTDDVRTDAGHLSRFDAVMLETGDELLIERGPVAVACLIEHDPA